MSAATNSPNWHWQRLGYSVEHDARGARTIRRPDGSTIEVPRAADEDNHSAELRAVESEHRRLPHGPEECRASQQDLPL